MNVAGIDIGSLTAETVILDNEKSVLSYSIVFTGASSKKACETSFKQALSSANLGSDGIAYIVSTGYGREIVPFANDQVTEITCHARGAHFLHPQTRSIIDVGGQDSKAIRVNEQGKVMKFAMNDKCAAGCGRFLEVMARALEVELEDMGELSLSSQRFVPISSMCTVFAESEVISLIAQDHPVEDIINGLHWSISDRIIGLLERVGVVEDIMMTGGVAKNIGVVNAIEKKLGIKLYISEEPQIVGALGAALVALDRGLSKGSKN